MSELECIGTNACRKYCEALLANGVDVCSDGGDCNVPSMFNIGEKSVVFDPRTTEEGIQNPDLVNNIGGALCQVLLEHSSTESDRSDIEELKDGFINVFEARINLWQAMLSATRGGRQFTDAELSHYQDKLSSAETTLQLHSGEAISDNVLVAQSASDHLTLNEHKLLFDDQMVTTVDRLVGNLMESKPTLIVGDKGIAKTQATKFVCELWEPEHEPVIISGHGDMMSNELIGQMEQDKETRVFAFKEGKLVQAMREGRPVIIDEVNVGDQSIVMRLQDILLRRPGDRILIQENGGNSIEIQHGFVVFATANEASARYQHRNVLDPAFRDRYDVISLRYPDSHNSKPIEEVPHSLMRLALASAVDERGVKSSHIDIRELETLVRLAHVTQHLYSVPASNARVANLGPSAQSTSNFLDEEPVMTDCITPRALVDIINRCSAGNKPGLSIQGELERAIFGLDQAGSSHNQVLARRMLNLLRR